MMYTTRRPYTRDYAINHASVASQQFFTGTMETMRGFVFAGGGGGWEINHYGLEETTYSQNSCNSTVEAAEGYSSTFFNKQVHESHSWPLIESSASACSTTSPRYCLIILSDRRSRTQLCSRTRKGKHASLRTNR